MSPCETPDCTNESIVGFGSPAVWLCVLHFREALKERRRFLDQMLASVGGGS